MSKELKDDYIFDYISEGRAKATSEETQAVQVSLKILVDNIKHLRKKDLIPTHNKKPNLFANLSNYSIFDFSKSIYSQNTYSEPRIHGKVLVFVSIT